MVRATGVALLCVVRGDAHRSCCCVQKADVAFLKEELEKTDNSQRCVSNVAASGWGGVFLTTVCHSPLDKYCRELDSGLLDWSNLHTPIFWRSNCRRMEARDFALLKYVHGWPLHACLRLW